MNFKRSSSNSQKGETVTRNQPRMKGNSRILACNWKWTRTESNRTIGAKSKGAGDFWIEGGGFGAKHDARLRGLGWVGELVRRNSRWSESGERIRKGGTARATPWPFGGWQWPMAMPKPNPRACSFSLVPWLGMSTQRFGLRLTANSWVPNERRAYILPCKADMFHTELCGSDDVWWL